MENENALKGFKTEHAEGIAATKAEFVKFLREGELPEDALDNVALFIYMVNDKPQFTAGAFFNRVVSDGIYDYIDYWDNPKKHGALMPCPACDGEGDVPKAVAPKLKLKTRSKRVRGV